MLKLNLEDTSLDIFSFDETDLVKFVKNTDNNSMKWNNFPWEKYLSKHVLQSLFRSKNKIILYIEGENTLIDAFGWSSVSDDWLGYNFSYWQTLYRSKTKFSELNARDKSFISFAANYRTVGVNNA